MKNKYNKTSPLEIPNTDTNHLYLLNVINKWLKMKSAQRYVCPSGANGGNALSTLLFGGDAIGRNGQSRHFLILRPNNLILI